MAASNWSSFFFCPAKTLYCHRALIPPPPLLGAMKAGRNHLNK
jgi:hypothetical protein